MLKTLYIKNFVLIDELLLNFGGGFNVLLGETGAGKSIIIKAIDTALGAKTSKEVLKNPEKHALIELTFEDDNGELVVSREISQTGTKCRVDGALVNLDAVKEERERLIDIHTQFETYTYMRQKFHIELLDLYVSSKESCYGALLDEMEENFKRYIAVRKMLDEIKTKLEDNARQTDFLKFQIDEIERAEIKENEEEELNRELEVLSNIQELKELSFGGYFALGGEDNSILEALGKIGYNISKIKDFDPDMAQMTEDFYNALENLREISSTLRNYSENLHDNPERLNEINERVEIIEKLKRKYGNIEESYQKFVEELKGLEAEGFSLDNLEKESFELEKTMDTLSSKISNMRHKYAKELSLAVSEELKKLEFERPEFLVSVTKAPLGVKGSDFVEFLITTNAAKELAPLVKTASGGEISRVMLALKTIFANTDKVSTVIFDEIDSGISGKTSISVANEISKLSGTTQVFAITHQPIIASKAQNAFWVSKVQLENDTKVNVVKLDTDGKIKALAQMSAGVVDEKSLNFAKELLAK